MGVGECRDVLFAHRLRVFLEVGVVDCVDRIDAFPPVKSHEILEQRQTLSRELTEPLHHGSSTRCELADRLGTGEILPARHALVVRGTNKIEDDLRLVKVALASKDGLALEHLAEHATSAPHVDCGGVSPQLKEKLWRSVPSCDDQRCVVSPCFAIASSSYRHWLIIVSCKAEICNLESPTVVDEQVGSLHISVEDVVVVKVAQTLEQLQHVALDLRLLELDVRVVEET